MSSFLNRLKKAHSVETNVLTVEGFLSDEECSDIIADIEKLSLVAATVGKENSVASVRTNTRDAQTAMYSKGAWISERLNDVLPQHYRVELTAFPFPSALKYKVGGHYVNHCDAQTMRYDDDDVFAVKTYDRDISVVIYLNDNFVGGAFNFEHTREVIIPKQGMLLAFPSDWRHEHRVFPVDEGTRYALVNWYPSAPHLVKEEERVPETVARYYTGS